MAKQVRPPHQIYQFVGEIAKSANFGFCALPMNRIITKTKYAIQALASWTSTRTFRLQKKTSTFLHWHVVTCNGVSNENATTGLVNHSPRSTPSLIDQIHHVTYVSPSEEIGHASRSSRLSRANARTTISLATVERLQDPRASCLSQQQRPVCGLLA
jgi:hypothetical protein